MTERDRLAELALPGILASVDSYYDAGVRMAGYSLTEAVVGIAYEIADAMIAARASPRSTEDTKP